MSERSSGISGWISGLFGAGRSEAPRQTGEELLTTGRRAVVAAEVLLGEAVCHSVMGAGLASTSAVNVFGKPVELMQVDGARGAVAAASGLAMSGRRATALINDVRLTDIRDQMRAAVERRLPVVMHLIVASASHSAYHDLADSGACMFFARNGQQALDLALVARRVAEQTLTPAIVAIDGQETARAVQDVLLPYGSLIGEYLGAPEDDIPSPTAAQTLLFGEKRRRVVRWFDLDRPAALGLPLSGPDLDSAVVGRRAFFAAELTPAIEESMALLSELTKRPVSPISRYRLDGARHVLVAQGAAVETAEAVAAHLRKSERAKIGVLGVTSLRPFPEDEIRSALSRAESATVVDRVAGDPAPLAREVRATLAGSKTRIISATCDELESSEFIAACRNMLAVESAKVSVRLGAAATAGSEYPRREALLQRVRGDYPALERMVLPAEEAVDLRPQGSRTLALHLPGEDLPEEILESLAEALGKSVGRRLRGRTVLAEPGLWQVCLTASDSELLDPGSGVPVEVALLSSVESSYEANPLAHSAGAGSVAVASELDAAAVWAHMKPSWRKSIRERELRLFVIRGGVQELVAAAPQLLEGRTEELEEIPWRELPAPQAPEVDRELPVVVRRFETVGSTYDNVSRFWGESAQPRIGGEGGAAVPEPYLAVGAVPACTATFHDMTPQRNNVPVIDPDLCIGCGKCWTACPDSAIGSTAIGTEALLNAAAEMAEAKSSDPPSAAAGKLKRAHRQLASRIDGRIANRSEEQLSLEMLREGFDWLVEQMKPGDDELPELTAAFERTLEEIAPLPLSVTDAFFLDRHSEQKGSGEAVVLAVNPQSCQGCGVCDAVCPEGAIRMEPQTEQAVQGMRAAWRTWEKLPDTPGKTIARVAEHFGVGALPAILMSRHCLFSVAGGDGAEPGSGERLATRHVAAVVEYHMQRNMLAQVDVMADLAGRLRETIRERLAAAVAVEELGDLDEALSAGSDLGDILGQSDVDLPAMRRLVRVARAVERGSRQVAEGFQGMGRARYGLVVADSNAASWAAHFPRNPFGVPVAVDLAGSGVDLAMGVIKGLVAERVAEAKLIRRAELLLEDPADLPARERELKALAWDDLSKEERALCPPVLVLASAENMTGRELDGLSRLLTCDLPVKIIMLDGCDLRERSADPLLLALAHRHAFVMAASVAHHAHLFRGMTAAMSFVGPALVRIHAPSPGRHGFAADGTIERARSAVESRVHPLVLYDPSAEGVFGSRLSLDGNPMVDREWATGPEDQEITPAQWAAGETRFDEYSKISSDERGSANSIVPGPNGASLAVGEILLRAARERLERWTTLQELSGVVTPFTENVRRRLEDELRAGHEAELSDLREEYEAKLAEMERGQSAAQAAKLRERLMQLAGYGKGKEE